MSAVPARAIELSLEENRAERGSVGTVDMRRLFKTSPDAARAREGLEELVRQAEERVNAKKAELLRLRAELGKLKLDREDLARSTPTVSVPVAPPPAPAPAPKPEPVKTEPPKEPELVRPGGPLNPTPAPAAPVTEAPPEPKSAEPAASTETPLTINLPGLTDGPLNLERPGASPLNPTGERAAVAPPAPPAPAVSPAPPVAQTPKEEPLPEPPAQTEPAPAPEPAPIAGPTHAQRLLELDGLIVAKQAQIDLVQKDLDNERLGAEKTLLDAEGRRTDQVLARLYRAISEVAKREGVSVVVDRSATLYGHGAVDLTEKVLKQLRGAAPTP